MYKITSIPRVIQWLASRVGVIYVIFFIFCLTCVDFKMLDMRIKTRHLNDSIPDFSDMIIFSKDQDAKKNINWKPYKDYFELILSYLPGDLVTRQLLGYVDFYSGQEQKAIALFKSSSTMSGHELFLSNYNLGVIYYKKEMWPQAAMYLLKAIESNPQLPILLMQNSIVYKQISASPYFKYSLGEDINDAQSRAYILLLSSLYHMRQFDRVLVISNLASTNQNLLYKDAFYYYGGLGFIEEGQAQKAFLLFQQSLNIEKNNPDVYYYIANIYQNAGKLDQAREFLQASYLLHQKNDPRFPYETHTNLIFF
jgi:tetratricopeptide (TPR) repeat protein